MARRLLGSRVLSRCTCTHVQHRPSARPHSTASAATVELVVDADSDLTQADVPAPTTSDLIKDLQTLLARYPLLEHSPWLHRLDTAAARLRSSSATPATIAIIGDRHSGVRELVTAALDDPLATDGDTSVKLASRRLDSGAPEAISITFGTRPNPNPQQITVDAAWLRNNNVEVVEIVHGDVPPQSSSIDTLFASDAVVLLLADSRGYSSAAAQALLAEFASKPGFIIAANSPLEPTTPSLSSVKAQLERFGLSQNTLPEIVSVSTCRAMNALEALAPTEASHKPSYERFSQGFITSGVPQLMEKLAQIAHLRNAPASESQVPSQSRLTAARHVLRRGIEAAALEGGKIAGTLHQASSDVAGLAFVAAESGAAVATALGVRDGLLRVPEEELREAVSALSEVLTGRLTWFKLPWRVDDIVPEIAAVASSTYLTSYETLLAYSTGRLTSLATTLSSRTTELVSTSAFSADGNGVSPLASLYSPVLLNRLAQASFDSLDIPSTALSSAVVNRRNQITAPGGPAETLQRRAQKAIMSSATLSTASVGLGMGLQIMQVAEVATNVGVGLFGTTLAAWLLQHRWIKAKDRFLVDVEKRVTGGLEEDLGVATKRLLERATYKARTAVALSEQVLRRKQADFDKFRRMLTELNDRVKQLP
ncbi:hypothetical protein OIV83_002840 [Microbotryomycetes sp. JL201]|nr:hypothetical protein OIV83_002840 [Microbotryomycetes sp. JL201]